jgi:Bifunctional DNA primase/polymerase, N-terminal/Phage integrase family
VTNLLLSAALLCARLRWRVVTLHNLTSDGACTCQEWRDSQGAGECGTKGKHPRFKGFVGLATCDEKQIRQWWAKCPDANVGLITGKGSRIFALDVDPRNGGNDSFAALIYKHGPLFPGDTPAAAILGTSLDHQHEDVREALKYGQEFVIHSLRHTMLTRLGESGADAFTIMKIAGHGSVTTSQRYVHPTPEGMERAFERLQDLNTTKFEAEKVEALAAAVGGGVPTKSPTVVSKPFRKSSQVVNIKRKGP